jgi:WD40 repeat protein
MQSPDVLEKKRIKIIPLSHRNKIRSKYELDSEIRGVIEIKGGYYLAGSKEGNIGIFDSEKLDLIQNFRINGIINIFHLEKIRDENSDLIAVASDVNEVIIISVFQKDDVDTNNMEVKENIFDYKFECRKEEHNGKINRIIQLSNDLLVSAAEDKLIIFWQLFKNDNVINIQSISKVEMNSDIHILIECPFTNELICNNITIDLNTFTPKRHLDIYLQAKSFNCQMCLFKEKYLAYVDGCDGITVINLENNRNYYITARFDYVEAVYSIDNETLCL